MMMTVIIRKELASLFMSPLAWLLLTMMQLVLAWFFLLQLDAYLEIQSQLQQLINPPGVTETIIAPVFAMAVIVLVMVIPILTMRLFAEERHNHTLPLLISAPISMWDIVIGKFLSLMMLWVFVIALLTMLSCSLGGGGILDYGLIVSNAIGLLLITACFSSAGLYISSLSSQPVVAAIGCVGMFLGLWMIDWLGEEALGGLHQLSLLKYFRLFNQGVIDSFGVVYGILFTLSFLVLAVWHLDGERVHG